MNGKFQRLFIALTLLALSTLNQEVSTAFAQGSLTPPPGPPGATMLTLSQVEPRTPVDAAHTTGNNDAEFVLNQAGSYYLTTNIFGGATTKTGIEILTNNVALDLNGFSLFGSSSAISGIYIAACTNITVRNGMISGWTNGYNGIRCDGLYATFERLAIYGNTHGIYCADGSVITDCMVIGSGADGITTGNNCIVSGCLSANNQGNGILVNSASGCFISGNTIEGNDAGKSANTAGICVVGSNNRIEGNHVTGTSAPGNGILVFNNASYTNNIIIRNSVEGGGTNNYSISATFNDVGPVGAAAAISSPWGNISHCRGIPGQFRQGDTFSDLGDEHLAGLHRQRVCPQRSRNCTSPKKWDSPDLLDCTLVLFAFFAWFAVKIIFLGEDLGVRWKVEINGGLHI